MVSSSPSLDKIAGEPKDWRWYVRDFARDAIRQLSGRYRSSGPTVYWTKDARGNWVCHIPMYRK